jgi:hypothetical protein
MMRTLSALVYLADKAFDLLAVNGSDAGGVSVILNRVDDDGRRIVGNLAGLSVVDPHLIAVVEIATPARAFGVFGVSVVRMSDPSPLAVLFMVAERAGLITAHFAFDPSTATLACHGIGVSSLSVIRTVYL